MKRVEQMKQIGIGLVQFRAGIDGGKMGDYDAETDEEGYVRSCLNALHRLTVACGRDWEEELERAQEYFDLDESELSEGAVHRLLRDNQDAQSTRYHMLSRDEVDALHTLLEGESKHTHAADLVAAAPDLLAALEGLIEMAEWANDIIRGEWGGDSDEIDLGKARAAVALAKGETL